MSKIQSIDTILSCITEDQSIDWSLLYNNIYNFSELYEDKYVDDQLFEFIFRYLKYSFYRGDKSHWEVYFLYKGHKCSFVSGKFGVYLCSVNRLEHNMEYTIFKKLIKCTVIIETFFKTSRKEQIDSGNCLISNYYTNLRNKYIYHRTRASKFFLYLKNPPKPSDISHLAKFLNKIHLYHSKAEYEFISMVDSFFSLLEHILVFCLPFCNYKREEDNILKFINSNWSVKYERILILNNCLISKEYYKQLKELKRYYRNPSSHGGFSTTGDCLITFLPGLENRAIRYSDQQSITFHHFLLDTDKFYEIAELLKQIIKWIFKEYPFTELYLKTTFSLDISEKGIQELKKYSKSRRVFKEWIKQLMESFCRYSNVEY